MKTFRIPLRVVFYQEEGAWIAHCLEFDLVGDGDSCKAALDSLAEAIGLQLEASVEHGNPRNLFRPAPGEFFQMFAEGKGVTIGELNFEIGPYKVEHTETREYDGVKQDCVPV